MSTTGAFTEVRDRLSEILDEVASGEEWVITRHGRRVAVLLSVEDYESLVETVNILSDTTAMGAVDTGLSELESGELDSDVG